MTRETKLEEGASYIYAAANKVHKTTATKVIYQCNTESCRDNALTALFSRIMEEQTLDVLSNKEQLGDMVYSSYQIMNGIGSIFFMIESDKAPTFIDERVENFLTFVKETLETMSHEEFEKNVKAEIEFKFREPNTLSRQSMQYFKEVRNGEYNFNRGSEKFAFFVILFFF